MSRLARAISGSGVYHILFQGVNQQDIFEEATDFEKLKETMMIVKKDLEFEIYAYCFMNNHVHIVLKKKFPIRQLQRITGISRGVITKA